MKNSASLYFAAAQSSAKYRKVRKEELKMIKDLLKPENIHFDVNPGHSKKSALKAISKLCGEHYSTIKESALYKNFVGREKIESTGFGGGIAIPHAKIDNLTNPFIAIVRFSKPVDWDSIDGKSVQVAIALVMPTVDTDNTHLEVLSHFSRKLADDEFLNRLLTEPDAVALYNYIIEQMGEELK
ncbi:hypothetical protein B6259_00850 [Ruminococcaceae bacterium CPB6]|nr:hypothetical protein B6259_00850 [Ruminococcaceae bacterium CPB6]